MSKKINFEFNDYIIAIDEPYKNDYGYVAIGKKQSNGINIVFKSPNENTVNWFIELQKYITNLQSQLDKANEKIMWLNAEIDALKSEKENLMRTLEEASEELEGAIVLPVNIGDTIYVVPSKTNYRLNIVNRREDRNKVYKYLVDEIRYNKYGFSIVSYIDSVPFYFNEKIPKNLCGHFDTEKYYGETWFTTRAEAQAKLQELRNGDFSGE